MLVLLENLFVVGDAFGRAMKSALAEGPKALADSDAAGASSRRR
jgi:hypothetical protein